MPQSRAPLIVAIVLLLLPVLYVGSYLALVVPSPPFVLYRLGGRYAVDFYSPLNLIDRKLRPGAWEPSAKLPSPHQTTIGEDGLERIGIDFK